MITSAFLSWRDDLVRTWCTGGLLFEAFDNSVAVSPEVSTPPLADQLSFSAFPVALRREHGGARNTDVSATPWRCSASVCFDPVYEGPTLWFSVYDDAGEVPPLEDVLAFVSANYFIFVAASPGRLGASDGVAPIASFGWHPITRVPAYYLHSCGAKGAFDELPSPSSFPSMMKAGSPLSILGGPFLAWLSTHLPLIGLSVRFKA